MAKSRRKLEVVPQLDLMRTAAEDEDDKEKQAGVDIPDQPAEAACKGENPFAKESVKGDDFEKGAVPIPGNSCKMSAEESKVVQAAMAILKGKGVGRVAIGTSAAKFFTVSDPDDPNARARDYDALMRSTGYPGNLSKNDAFFFNVPGMPPAKGVQGSEKVTLSTAQLGAIIRNATEIGGRNVVSTVFNQLRQAGFQIVRMGGADTSGYEDSLGKGSSPDSQKMIEDSRRPTHELADKMPYDEADPKSIEALEHVDELPFDDIKPEFKGKEIGSDPSKRDPAKM